MYKPIKDKIIIRAERPKTAIETIMTGQYYEKKEFLTYPLMVMAVGDEVKQVKTGQRVAIGIKNYTKIEPLKEFLQCDEQNKNLMYFVIEEDKIAAIIEQ